MVFAFARMGAVTPRPNSASRINCLIRAAECAELLMEFVQASPDPTQG